MPSRRDSIAGGQLPGAQRQRRRFAVEGVDHVAAVRAAQAVMQRQEGSGLNAIHGRRARQTTRRIDWLRFYEAHRAWALSRSPMPMKDLPAELRPREKLLARGPGALSDIELLALLLRTGLKGQGVFELARQVLDEFKGFAGLLRADAADLKCIKALGPAKRAEVAAVVEMARRALAQPLRDAAVFDAPQKVKDYVALQLGARSQEVFAVMFLDGQHRLIEFELLFHGSLTQTSVYPREIVRQALKHNAGAVILAHNHPLC